MSTDNESILKEVAECLESRLATVGFIQENNFKSHITLARIKTPKNINILTEQIKKIKPAGNFEVNTLCLFKSTLSPQGAIYEELAKTILTR